MADLAHKKEIHSMFYAVKSGVYPYGEDGVMAEGDISMMKAVRGFQSFDASQQRPTLRQILADGGVYDSYFTQPTANPEATLGLITLDADLTARGQGYSTYTEGEHTAFERISTGISYANIALVINYNARVRDAATGEISNKYLVEEYFNCELFGLMSGGSGNPEDEPPGHDYAMSITSSASLLHGASTNQTNAFMRSYISDNPVVYGTIIGNNSDTQFTIPSAFDPAGASATYVQMWDDGTEQDYGSSAGEFELNSTNNQLIDFATAPGSGSIHVFKLEFVPTALGVGA